MANYIILANPGHNRIYFDTALQIAKTELHTMANKRQINIHDIEEVSIGSAFGIKFCVETELLKEDLEMITSLSIYYAIFKEVSDGHLLPLLPTDFHVFPESIVQILKYAGKTNEQFTRLLVNIAMSNCDTNSKKKTLLDPMCGKGTTLYEGLIRGLDVKGTDMNKKWIQEIQIFIVRYLKEGKFKHKAQKINQADASGKAHAQGMQVKMAPTKETFNEQDSITFTVLNADAKEVDKFIKSKSCDMIVCDLPYGVQHGTKHSQSKIERKPLHILEEAIPNWRKVIRTKGSIVLAFNEYTMKYKEIASVLEQNQFEVVDYSAYGSFIHRVDQAINRNIIVGQAK